MLVSEAIIVYLAVGAPFGVYHVTTHPGDTVISSVANGTLNVVAWPVYIGLFVYAHFRHGKASVSVDSLKMALERATSEILATNKGREFRDLLSRYIALSEAVELPIGTAAIEGLADVGFIRHSIAASRVAARANRKRLIAHRAAACTELVAMVRSIRDPDVATLLTTLAEGLGDHIDLGKETSRDPARHSRDPISIAA